MVSIITDDDKILESANEAYKFISKICNLLIRRSISKFDVKMNTKIQFMNDIHAMGRIESIRVYPEQAQPGEYR